MLYWAFCYRSRTTTFSPAATCAVAVLRLHMETELCKDPTNALTNWRKITAEMKPNKDAISENRTMKQKHPRCTKLQEKLPKSDSYIWVPKNGTVGREYLEDASHLQSYERTCEKKKTQHLRVCFCWGCRHLECTFETEPGAVTEHTSVNCMCLTLLMPPYFAQTYWKERPLLLFSCTYVTKGTSTEHIQTEHFPPFRTGVHIYFYRLLLASPSTAGHSPYKHLRQSLFLIL